VCDCIKKANKELAAHNTVIESVSVIDKESFGKKVLRTKEKLCVPTKKLNPKSRAKPLKVFMNFCPMCGEAVPS
jgi:hypothetical protein